MAGQPWRSMPSPTRTPSSAASRPGQRTRCASTAAPRTPPGPPSPMASSSASTAPPSTAASASTSPSSDQLKMMASGGNNRAHTFFKQHRWMGGGKVEAKYTSRATELYRQIMQKEVAKSSTADNGLPSSPVAASLPPNPSNDLPEFKLLDAPEENTNGKQEPDVTNSPKTPTHSPKAPTHPTFVSSVKKPIGAKKVGGKTGGLGVRKLTTKQNESLYDQKPEEPKLALPSLTTSAAKSGPSLHSRFEYVDNEPSADSRTGGAQVTGHVAPPKSSNFFQEYGMDNEFQRKTSTAASKTQVKAALMLMLHQ